MNTISLVRIYIALMITGMLNITNASYFRLPYDADLYMRFINGGASAITEFGIGTSTGNYTPYFTNLPNNAFPSSEVLSGTYKSGTNINFYLKTLYTETYWAFSNRMDIASQYAFSDIDNSLGFNGLTLQQTSYSTWLLHLDDAASYMYDDDDNDILMQIRLAAVSSVKEVPESPTLLLLGIGFVCFACIHSRKKIIRFFI